MNFFSFNFSLRGVAKVNSLLVQIVGTARRDVSKKKKAERGEEGSLVIV